MEKFNLELMSMGNEQFIVYRPANSDSIINYQLQMLTNNSISGVLSLSRRQNNEDVALMYNITGMQTLKDYMAKKNNKLTKSEFIKLISSMMNVFDDIYPYQLPSGGVLINPEYIYIKENEFIPSYVYIPVYNNDKPIDELKEFFMGFVINSNIEETTDNFIQRLINLMNSDNLSMKKIKEFIRQRDSSNRNVKNIVPPPRNVISKPSDSDVHNRDNNIPIKNDNIPSPIPPRTTEPKMPYKKQVSQKETSASNDDKTASKGNGAFKKVVFAVMAVVVVLIVAFLYMNNVFVVDGQLKVEYIGAALIVGAAVLFIAYREMFVNNKDKAAKESGNKNSIAASKSKNSKQINKPTPPKPIPGKPIPPKPASAKPIPPKPELSKNVPISRSNEQNYANVSVRNSDKLYQADDEADTDIMEEYNGEAYLEMYENGSAVRFYIGSHPILVGKQRSRVDYAIANNRVSKVHAEFGYRNGSYYVKDNHSTNGTYINNGSRITPGSEIEIVSGDTVRLADVELIFKTM